MTFSSLLLCTSIACGALASAQVSHASPHQPPAIIYVDRFSTQDILDKANDSAILGGGADNSLTNQHKQQQYDLLQKLPIILQKTLVQGLNQGIARAAVGDGTLATQLNCWVVRGQFLVVDQGSRSMQSGVGFGGGQSHVEIHAQIYTLNDPNTPFLTFDAKGASGHMPDAAMTTNPYVTSTKIVMAKKEPEKETRKVGRQIADEIGKFMAAQNIPTLKAMKETGMTPPPPAPDYPQVSPIYSSKSAAP